MAYKQKNKTIFTDTHVITYKPRTFKGPVVPASSQLPKGELPAGVTPKKRLINKMVKRKVEKQVNLSGSGFHKPNLLKLEKANMELTGLKTTHPEVTPKQSGQKNDRKGRKILRSLGKFIKKINNSN